MRKGEQVHTFSIDRLILKHPKINLMYISLVMTKLNHLTLSISKSKFMIISSSQRLNIRLILFHLRLITWVLMK